MKITVKFFAQLKDTVSSEEMTLDAPAELHVRELRTFLGGKIPGLGKFLKHGTQIAVNCELVGREACIYESDEVALLPPFSGG